MKIEFMIPSIIVAIVIFIILLNVGRANYYDAKKEKFLMGSMFPYEMQDGLYYKYNWNVRFIALFLALALSLFAINSFELTLQPNLSFLLIVMIVNAVIMMCLFFTTMRNATLHMILSIAHFGLTFITYATMANYVFFYNTVDYPLYLGIICVILVVVMLLLFINPKLYKWMYMERQEENGTSTLKRPKVLLLATYEWIFMILTIVFDLLLTIVTLLM